jgi:putative CocE/NonD family hydrolase
MFPMGDDHIRRFTSTTLALWLLTALFVLRVVGQLLVESGHGRFLPPSEEWFSGLMPYPQLLASQIVLIVLMAAVGIQFTRQAGWAYRPRRLAGTLLLTFGVLYLSAMIVRYAVRMTLYPPERWTGGSIPIYFHWVLAAWVLVVGRHHRRHSPPPAPPSAGLRWLVRVAWIVGGTTVLTGFVLWIVYLVGPALLAHTLEIRPAEFAVRIDRGVAMTAADGTRLVADVYHPVRAGPTTPTILVRIPYSKTTENTLFATIVGRMWAERGYTVVFQGTRGRYESGGEYYPLRNERQDGLDTLAWLARQPWFDGRLGTWGCSYYGYTQWAVADQVDPGLTAPIIQECSTDFHRMFYPGGAFSLKSALYWTVLSHGPRDVPPTSEAMRPGFAGFPLIDADKRATGDITFFNDWVGHPDRDDYWAAIDGSDRAGRLKAPVLLMGGWYDPFLPGQLADFARIRTAADPHVAAETRLVIGPWAHAETVTYPDGTSPRNFRLECLAPSIPWFDRHLLRVKGPPAAPVRIYVQGIHQWRDEQEWPPARMRPTPYYLHGAGRAGTLTAEPPTGDDPPDSFVYDPRDPVPTAGGAMLGEGAGVARQNKVETRPDVVSYSTSPLPDDLEITGPVRLVLHVATTAANTDFTGKLVDVNLASEAYNVCDGILRRSYRPGEVEEITIDLWPTSMVFRRGHRIRLEVSSSNYPRFDRNPNTGRRIATETEPITAAQSVYHDRARPAHVFLPLIPK